MTAKTICLFAEKGGVGRTTTVINLAGVLADQKHRVLLVDTDSQASLSQFFLGPDMVDDLHKSQTIAALFDDSVDPPAEELIIETSLAGVSLLPASDHLKRHNLPNPEATGELQFALREALQEVQESFDFIILDTPPDIGNLPAWVCLLAADFVITPVVPETFSGQAISGVDRVLGKASERNPRLRFAGYLINMRKKVSTFHDVNEERLRAIHGDRVFDTVLTNLTAFSEAQGMRQAITTYRPDSQAAKLTVKFSKELLARVKRLSGNNKRKVA